MRKLLKFLHSMASAGFIGALAALIVLHLALPDPVDLERFAALREAQGMVATWILLPSMAIVVASGLLAMVATPAFHDLGWVWVKLALGIVVFEGTLVFVQGPMESAAEKARQALAGEVPVAELGRTLPNEWGPFWVIMGVAVLNVALGVWRPRRWPWEAWTTSRGRDRAPSGPEPEADASERG
jgi:hypothetical protein